MSADSARMAITRLSGFSASVGIVTVLGIISIPVLSSAVGKQAWGVLALIQTVAQFGGILVAFGWGVTGAATVASVGAGRRRAVFRQSLAARALLYVGVAPILAILMCILTRGDVLVSVIGAIVYLLPNLGASWYFAGEGRPKRLVLFDTIPAVAGAMMGLVAAWVTGLLVLYIVFQGVGYLVAVLLSAAVVLRDTRDETEPQMESIWRALVNQRHAVFANLVSGLYVTLPMVAVQIFLPASLSMYAIADRLFKYCSLAFLPIQQFFQSWVPDPNADFRRRAKIASMSASVIGLVAGALIATLSPWVSGLLSVGVNVVSWQVSLPLGVAFVGIATAAVVGYACLVAVHRVQAIAVSTAIGAVIGAPLILLFAALGSAPLVAWSVAISELCVAGYQVLVLRKVLLERKAAA